MSGWRLLVLTGSEVAVRAFVVGFAASRGDSAGVVLGDDVKIGVESLAERLKELFGAGGHHCVLATEALGAALAGAVQQIGATVGLGLERSHPVAVASFAFRLETFSRALAGEVRGVLTTLPEGVHVEGFTQNEEQHPGARGPEPFAPLHAYAYRATGRIVGALTGVLAVRRQFAAYEVVHLDSLTVTGIGNG